jgi:ankyrin repeat protein
MKKILLPAFPLIIFLFILSCASTGNSRKESILIPAVASNNEAEVIRLVEKGADLNRIDSNGNTALTSAVQNNNSKMVELLIKSGADVNLQIKPVSGPNYGRVSSNSAFLESLNLKDNKIAILLINNGAELNEELHYSVSRKDMDQIRLLLELGADINWKSERGNTALIESSYSGKNEITEFLISKGAKTNIQSNNGKTALWVASFFQNREIVETLLEAGADTNLKTNNIDKLADPYAETALIVSCEKKDRKIAELLINSGADVNWIEADGSTALINACIFKSDIELVKLLINNGADLDIQNKWGDTALTLSAKHGNRDIMELLIKSGAVIDVNEEDIESLKYFLEQEDFQNIEFLIKKSAK